MSLIVKGYGETPLIVTQGFGEWYVPTIAFTFVSDASTVTVVLTDFGIAMLSIFPLAEALISDLDSILAILSDSHV